MMFVFPYAGIIQFKSQGIFSAAVRQGTPNTIMVTDSPFAYLVGSRAAGFKGRQLIFCRCENRALAFCSINLTL